MLLFLLLGSIILPGCLLADSNLDIGNGNEFFDNFLSELLQQAKIVEDLEPLKISDINHDNLKTSKGRVWGLSSTRREGDCTYSISETDKNGKPLKTVFVKAEVAAKNVNFSMNYRTKVLFITVDGVLEGKVKKVKAQASLYINEKGASLDSFKISSVDFFEVTRVSANNQQSSSLLKKVANFIATKAKPQIVKALEKGVTSYIKQVLKDNPIPEEG